jgi:exopolysaccharide production protein ExoZ
MYSTLTPQPPEITVQPQLEANSRLKLDSIQYLRAIAAIAVVFGHGSTSLFANGRALIPLAQIGAKGVDLFFVISGFLMFFTTDQKRVLPRKFFRRRLIRIVPLYFILSTFGFVMAIISPHSFQMLTARPIDYLRSNKSANSGS